MANNEIFVTVSNKSQSVGVGVAGGNNKIGITGDNSQYFSNEARKSAEQAKQSATEAQNFAEQAENSKDELLNDTGFVGVKDNLDRIITTAVNIEDINTNAENIEAIKNASAIALEKADRDLSNLTEEGQSKFDEKANKSLNNLDEQGEKHFLGNSQITNCIKEIPQRIKLELNNGVLTLKAGSEVIVPNGFEADGVTPKFEYRTISADKTRTGGTANKKVFVMLNSGLDIIMRPVDYAVSGQTVTTSDNTTWYDTANNVVKAYYGASPISSGCTLPLAIASCDSSGAITSIDQVFNGFGYIGSTVWVDKGVKGLIPNGRNEDGSLKNIEAHTERVLTYTNVTGVSSGRYYSFKTPVNGVWTSLDFKTIDDLNVGTPTSLWYFSETENKWLFDGNEHPWLDFAYSTDAIASPYKITSFKPKLPFRAADDQDVVKKAGDTMTGTLSVQFPTNYDYTSTTAPSTEIVAGNFTIKDKNGKGVTTLQNYYNIYNNMVTRLYTTRNVGGVDMIAALQLYVGADGAAKFDFPKCTAKATTSSTAHNGNVAVITQNYKNGHSWYRVWSDGWIEQGGRIQTTATGTITFPKAFTGSDYKMLTNIINMTANQPKTVYLHTNTTTSIVFDCRSQSGQGASQEACTFVWYACGY